MKQKVMFATPTYDYRVSGEYLASMMMTSIHLTHLRIEVTAQLVAGLCFIDLARNKLTSAFLKSDCTDLFMIDEDVGWDYLAVKRFLDYKQEIVAGLVPKKLDSEAFHDNALTGEIEDGLIASLEAPTAFIRIKRSALEKYLKAYPEFADYYTLDTGAAIWQTGFSRNPENGKMDFRGEDIFFCRQWIAMGEKIWIDPQVEFTHRGSRVWKGNFIEHAIAKGTLTATKEPICQVEPLSLTGT
jgi:hypothetical protein